MSIIWPLPRVEWIPLDQVEEMRPVILVTTAGAWQAVEANLGQLPIVRRIEIRQARLNPWIEITGALLRDLPGLQDPLIYAVGGGLAVDAAKYIAKHGDLPLISLPTALSVDAFFTWASGVRHQGCVQYLETRPPDRVLIDFDVLAAAPEGLRAAGICDVLSIATGLWDWEYAEEQGKNPEGMALVPWAADAALAILEGALECAEAAGAGDPDGLKQLLDCLALEVQLCNQLGHSRPEEGSEHYFAYAVENHLAGGLTHAELVGPGTLLMAERQDQDCDSLRRAMEDCHVPLSTIPQAIVEQTLRELPRYVRHHDLPYGIAHDLPTHEAT